MYDRADEARDMEETRLFAVKLLAADLFVARWAPWS